MSECCDPFGEGTSLHEFDLHHGQECFDFSLRFSGIALRAKREGQGFEMGKGRKNRQALVGKWKFVERERLQLYGFGKEAQIRVRETAAIGDGKAAQGRKGFEGGEGFG